MLWKAIAGAVAIALGYAAVLWIISYGMAAFLEWWRK